MERYRQSMEEKRIMDNLNFCLKVTGSADTWRRPVEIITKTNDDISNVSNR